jgi:hypothetical protein
MSNLYDGIFSLEILHNNFVEVDEKRTKIVRLEPGNEA